VDLQVELWGRIFVNLGFLGGRSWWILGFFGVDLGGSWISLVVDLVDLGFLVVDLGGSWISG